MLTVFNAIRSRGSAARGPVTDASAAASRAQIADASGSGLPSSGSTALITRWVAWIPIPANSDAVRPASASDVACGRATSTSLVVAGSVRVASARAYWSRCLSSPDMGPRQDASPPESMKPAQSPGSCSSRIVCPVGAVSNTTWS